MLHCLVFMVPHPLSRVQKLFYHSFFLLSTLFFIFFDVFFELAAFRVPPFQARVVVYHFLLPFVNSFFQKMLFFIYGFLASDGKALLFSFKM